MCVCKKHPHARWLIQALISCCIQQSINLGQISDYSTFFIYLLSNCHQESSTYLNWDCTPDKYTICNDILLKFEQLKNNLLSQDDGVTTVNLQDFDEVEIITKNGDITKRLKLLSRQANLCDIITSTSLQLPKIINHRNHLRHYRSTINEFREFDDILIDIDFSENLSIPVKYELLHWCHEQVTIHSGILKVGGKKSYHPYVSNERRHDQSFVHIVLEKMLEEVDMKLHSYIVIESDNCSVQYKSAQHFNNMQELADKYNTNLIRIFGIPEHGKGEVDYVCGIAKNVVRKEIAGGRFLQDASKIV